MTDIYIFIYYLCRAHGLSGSWIVGLKHCRVAVRRATIRLAHGCLAHDRIPGGSVVLENKEDGSRFQDFGRKTLVQFTWSQSILVIYRSVYTYFPHKCNIVYCIFLRCYILLFNEYTYILEVCHFYQ